MTRTAAVGRLTEADCRLEDLVEVLAARTDGADYPYADAVVDEVLVYDAAQLRRSPHAEVAAELVRALADGPGIVVFRGAFRPGGGRPGHRGVRGADRRAARRRRRRR